MADHRDRPHGQGPVDRSRTDPVTAARLLQVEARDLLATAEHLSHTARALLAQAELLEALAQPSSAKASHRPGEHPHSA